MQEWNDVPANAPKAGVWSETADFSENFHKRCRFSLADVLY